mgnify:CR=1 FL=1
MQNISMLEAMGVEHHAMAKVLEENFPPITPTPDDSIEKIMYRSGQRSVVEWLINRIENNG